MVSARSLILTLCMVNIQKGICNQEGFMIFRFYIITAHLLHYNGLFLMGGHSKEGADRFTCSMDKISTTNHQCVNEMEI